ncbi:MAG: polysaccharide biosynthesis tyrosine autokinase [Synoicihabitans sp.]
MALRERWIGGLTLSLVVVALVSWFQLRIPPLYDAAASLSYTPPNRVLSVSPTADRAQQQLFRGIFAFNIAEQVTGSENVALVVESLSDDQKEKIVAPYRVEDAPPGNDLRRELERILRSSVTVRPQEDRITIRIEARHRSAESAALIANTFAEQFLRFLASQNDADSSSAVQFLEQQAEELSRKLEEFETALQTYREESNLVSLEEKQNVILDQLKALSAAVTSARIERIAIETRLAQARQIIIDGGSPQEIAKLTSNSELATTLGRINDLNATYTVMAQKYGRRHPRMIETEREIAALSTLREQKVSSALAELENQLSNARAQEQQLERELAESEAENLRLDKMGVRYNVLRREVDTTRSTYSQILARLNDTRITAQLDAEVFRLGHRAFVPQSPSVPNTRKVATIAAFLGIILFFGYPLLMEVLISRIRSWDDVENSLQSNLLGEFADYRKIPARDRAHLFLKNIDENGREAFSALYSQLRLTSEIEGRKTIIVTSSIPGEGKSFIAANLAAVFSTHKHKTLLVDCDFRRPVQHRNWQRKNDRGILNWLALENPGDPKLDDEALGIAEIAPNLDFLAAGGTSRSITELMQPDGDFMRLFGVLRQNYDIIVIDTPPAGVFPDSVALAETADELVFVSRFNTVTRKHAAQVLKLLRQTNLKIPGVVLNGMPTGRSGALYYSSYGYNYHGSKYRSNYTEKALDS